MVSKVVDYGEPKKKVLVALPVAQIDKVRSVIDGTELTFVGFVRGALDRELERQQELADRQKK